MTPRTWKCHSTPGSRGGVTGRERVHRPGVLLVLGSRVGARSLMVNLKHRSGNLKCRKGGGNPSGPKGQLLKPTKISRTKGLRWGRGGLPVYLRHPPLKCTPLQSKLKSGTCIRNTPPSKPKPGLHDNQLFPPLGAALRRKGTEIKESDCLFSPFLQLWSVFCNVPCFQGGGDFG